ncbi:branched-chain amino acid transport system substrate-binding protein [Bradyrhizobium sp. USDA 4532]|uniref:ABC transporter substrate-binding protein n=2 Tax=Nitrobacteraceae TaxID=41294 RepID=UPI000975881E|nr:MULTISPECIES: ABC transporter substrate-binding protein [Bradyrhizobium]MCP1833856.1 branched-chain amino acid transport system substrate-binding protein [Bradyrhizobium sp. USDA 4545]MCP1907712.1 branched-chain amino acid transport system substrate-binding protein [Bradyrhizobium elkanii]MCP1918601.1 branched-chain amino acid transport system substrate-binding protein [Bradyrhizobium sp. USDA 4532]OMI12036.1 ABC transporter permease [Bradyrhizobium brasilense]
MKRSIAASVTTALVMATSLAFCGGASAQTMDKVAKVGALGDQSGLYQDIGGPGSTVAAQMAIEDSGLLAKGWKIDLISADHQNKPDVAVNIGKQWIDVEKVDVFVDLAASNVGLAIANLSKEKNVVNLNSGSASSDLTGAQCSPNTVHWVYDTYMLANGTGKALVKSGGDTWFFLTADYAFGQALERDTSAVVTANGGKVLGSVKHPLNNADFSSFLLQAQSSKAKIVGLANAGGDTTNAIKQAAEFGIVSGGQRLAGMLLFITDINALGLNVAQGLNFTETFYWDMNDQTRAFSKRFMERFKKNPPTMVQAGVYSSLIHYFKALEALGGNPHDGRAVVAKMKEMPTDDPLFGKGSIRVDGRKIHPAYLFEVKKPSDSKYPWDYYKLVATIPADEAFLPLEKSVCPLVKKS